MICISLWKCEYCWIVTSSSSRAKSWKYSRLRSLFFCKYQTAKLGGILQSTLLKNVSIYLSGNFFLFNFLTIFFLFSWNLSHTNIQIHFFAVTFSTRKKKKKSNIYFSFELHLKANNFFPQLLIINKRKLNLGSYYLCCFYFIPPDYPSKYLHSKH